MIPKANIAGAHVGRADAARSCRRTAALEHLVRLACRSSSQMSGQGNLTVLWSSSSSQAPCTAWSCRSTKCRSTNGAAERCCASEAGI